MTEFEKVIQVLDENNIDYNVNVNGDYGVELM